MRTPATKAEFDLILREAAAAARPVVVDFTASWCGPCQRIAPAFEALAAEFSWCDFVKVDVDVNQETAMACQISAMPTFKVFSNLQEVGALRGASADALRQLVAQHAGSKPVPRDRAAELKARQAAQRDALATLLAVSDKERLRVALSTILKLVCNILSDPNEPKFRSVKVENKAIKERVLACPGGRALLVSGGFEPRQVGEIARPELLVLPDDADVAELAQMRVALEALLANLPPAPGPASTA